MKLAKHLKWDDLALNDFIGRADRQDQIEEAKDRVRYQSERRSDSRGRVFAIAGAPRREERRPSSATRRPRKGSEEWQIWCKAREACFKYGNPGYIVRDCPQTTGTSVTKPQLRSSSLYSRKSKVNRFPRNRTFLRSPSADRKPAQRKVSFEEVKNRV
jgi:hypothetical protein